jgi:hypothetical protein
MRSLVDHKVGQAGRLIFEGAPLVLAPFEQDTEARKAIVHEREVNVVDSRVAVPPVTTAEQREHDRLLAEAKRHFAPEVSRIKARRRKEVEEKAKGKLGAKAAKEIVDALFDDIVAAEFPLEFDDPTIGTVTASDVAHEPGR